MSLSSSSESESDSDSDMDEEQLLFQQSLREETARVAGETKTKTTTKRNSPKSITSSTSRPVSNSVKPNNIKSPPIVNNVRVGRSATKAKPKKRSKPKPILTQSASFVGLSSSDDDSDSDDDDFFRNVNSLLDDINIRKTKKKQQEEEAKLAKETEEKRRKEEEEKLIRQLEQKHSQTEARLQEQLEKEKAEKEIYKRQSALSKGGSQEAQIKLIERINKEVDDQINNRDDPGIFGFIGTFFGLCASGRDNEDDDDI